MDNLKEIFLEVPTSKWFASTINDTLNCKLRDGNGKLISTFAIYKTMGSIDLEFRDRDNKPVKEYIIKLRFISFATIYAMVTLVTFGLWYDYGGHHLSIFYSVLVCLPIILFGVGYNLRKIKYIKKYKEIKRHIKSIEIEKSNESNLVSEILNNDLKLSRRVKIKKIGIK